MLFTLAATFGVAVLVYETPLSLGGHFKRLRSGSGLWFDCLSLNRVRWIFNFVIVLLLGGFRLGAFPVEVCFFVLTSFRDLGQADSPKGMKVSSKRSLNAQINPAEPAPN